MRPSVGAAKPEIIENSVVLPAPFGPISAVMRPVSAVNDALSTASNPPKRFDTFSTWSSVSATAVLRRCGVLGLLEHASHARDQSEQAAWRKGHHENQHATVDHEIETRCVAGQKLGELAQRLDHQSAEQRPEHRADAADDRCEQRLDRDPRAVGDAGIDEQEILRVEA